MGSAVWDTEPDKEMPLEEWEALRERRLRIDPDSLLRLTACRHAMTAAGLAWPDSRIHFQRNHSRATEEMCKKFMSLPPDERPEVLVGHSAFDVERLAEHLLSHGHAIKGAGAVDHWHWRGKALPIVSDMREVGAAAAALLVSRLQRPGRPYFNVGVRMSFAPGRVARESGRQDTANPATVAAAREEGPD
jgi:hypothetical protein